MSGHARCNESKAVWTWVAVSVLLSCAAAYGKIIYVDDDAPPGGDGTSWQTAHRYLQDALADANSADKPVDIRVAQGTYKPDQGANQTPGDREASFHLISGVTIKGGYAGLGAPDPNAQDIAQYETVLSGDLAGDDVDVNEAAELWVGPSRVANSIHVVTASGVDETAVLQEVTITGGSAAAGAGHPADQELDRRGGGICVDWASPTILRCTFKHNRALGGGGMFLGGSTAHVTSCRFICNYSAGRGSLGGGGGVLNESSATVFLDCKFEGNATDTHGGGMLVSDGRVWDSSSRLTLSACEFNMNSASYGGGLTFGGGSAKMTGCLVTANRARNGGGIDCSGSSLEIADSVVARNLADTGNGGGILARHGTWLDIRDTDLRGNRASGSGGGICCTPGNSTSQIRLLRCVITANKADTDGGGAFFLYPRADISNCIVVGNYASACGGAWCRFFVGSVRSSVFWDNREATGASETAQIRLGLLDDQEPAGVNYSCVKGWTGELGGLGNTGNDPCFADPGHWDPNGTPDDPNDDLWIDGDYHLKSQAGRWQPATQSWVADNATSPCIDGGDPLFPIEHEPFPNGGVVNMGAYGGTFEASKSYFGEPLCETIVAGDINGDCTVDFKDFALIALHWLQHEVGSAGDPRPADGATDVPYKHTDFLSWTAGINAVWHDVYIGTDRAAVAAADSHSPEYKGRTLRTLYHEYGLFSSQTTYYWRIDEIGYLGERAGQVWSFSTK